MNRFPVGAVGHRHLGSVAAVAVNFLDLVSDANAAAGR